MKFEFTAKGRWQTGRPPLRKSMLAMWLLGQLVASLIPVHVWIHVFMGMLMAELS